jgi:predicted Zn-dependent peptidase
MDDMKKGNITEEELSKAKEYYLSTIDEMLDNPSQIIGIYFSMDKIGLDDIEKRKEIIKNIKIEDIVKLSNKIFIDTIYLLGGDGK